MNTARAANDTALKLVRAGVEKWLDYASFLQNDDGTLSKQAFDFIAFEIRDEFTRDGNL